MPTQDSLTLEQLVEYGKYNAVNKEIKSDGFPTEKTRSKPEMAIFSSSRYIETKDILAEMKRQGYRPATIKDLAELGAAHPDMQREFPIVALGSWLYGGGDRRFPFLHGCATMRVFFLCVERLCVPWHPICRFAAARE
ncbi:MAG: hypothetical protein HY813_03680 [Candidatus Portnoybacteria bacterium]|nr:hypothetical protein [Candidatus Portnoybacteria bacterium]